MSRIGVVFPGQGSQRRGMALDFCEQYAEARKVFVTASEVLSLNVESICREEDPRLDMTEFTQPCILAAELAMFETLKVHFGFDPQYFGGHSLGEYSALVAAGAIPLDIALKLVHARGKLMKWGVPPTGGRMAAVIMDDLPRDEIAELAFEKNVDMANDNSPAQVVISGEKASVDELCEKISVLYQAKSVRVVALTVSAPFHSRHMMEVESMFAKVLESHKQHFDARKAARVTSNYTGGFHTGLPEDLIDALTHQVSGRVKWRDNMIALHEKADEIYELGPNRPLSGFFRSVGVSVQSIIDLRTARRALFGAEAG